MELSKLDKKYFIACSHHSSTKFDEKKLIKVSEIPLYINRTLISETFSIFGTISKINMTTKNLW